MKPVFERFPALDAIAGFRAGFINRLPDIDVRTDRVRLNAEHRAILKREGVGDGNTVTAEQVHGDRVARVHAADIGHSASEADGLLTVQRSVPLAIYVADCAPVWIVDPQMRGFALVHSGRKGTELGIVSRAIRELCEASGALPSELILQIGPCIRPPLYEVDFAARIVKQAREGGIKHVNDCGICTGSDIQRYYSYRVEKGQTGRMLAVGMMI